MMMSSVQTNQTPLFHIGLLTCQRDQSESNRLHTWSERYFQPLVQRELYADMHDAKQRRSQSLVQPSHPFPTHDRHHGVNAVLVVMVGDPSLLCLLNGMAELATPNASAIVIKPPYRATHNARSHTMSLVLMSHSGDVASVDVAPAHIAASRCSRELSFRSPARESDIQ
jgi:hypothetical protein